MFQELKPLVGKSPIAMMVAEEGSQLRVTITQKKSKGGAPLSLSILATPEELDRDLPGSIATAAGEISRPAPVADQVREQVKAARSAPKVERKAKTRTPKPAKPKPIKQAKSPKHKTRATPRVTLPGKKKAASSQPSSKPAPKPTPRSTVSADGVKHHASKPNKEACIADYKAMKEQHGDKLNRELFLDKSKTGRRFERLWGMSWRKFVEEAEGSKIKPRTLAGDSAKPAAMPAPAKRTRASGTQLSILPDTWPFPTPPKDVELGQDKNDTSHGRDVYDEKGRYLSSITTDPEVGGTIGLIGHDHPLRVFAIDGRRVMVKAVAPAKSATPPATAGTGPSKEDSGPAAAADQRPRVIKTPQGVFLAGGWTRPVKTGEEITIGRSLWIVKHEDERQITVEPKEETTA